MNFFSNNSHKCIFGLAGFSNSGKTTLALSLIKVFRKKDFLQLPFFNHIHRYLPFLFNTFGGKIISIPVNHRSRSSGISKYSNFQRFLVGINDLYGVIWLRKRSVWPILKKRDKHLKSKEKT